MGNDFRKGFHRRNCWRKLGSNPIIQRLTLGLLRQPGVFHFLPCFRCHYPGAAHSPLPPVESRKKDKPTGLFECYLLTPGRSNRMSAAICAAFRKRIVRNRLPAYPFSVGSPFRVWERTYVRFIRSRSCDLTMSHPSGTISNNNLEKGV